MYADIKDFAHYLKYEKQLAEHTQKNYRRDLNKATIFFRREGVSKWEQVDDLLIRSYISKQRKNGLAASSLSRELSSLRQFFNFLLRKRKIKHNPTELIQAPKRSQKIPSAPSIEQMQQLLHSESDDILALRDQAMFELFYSSGLRLSELTQLNLGDLRLTEAMLRVTGKGNKQRDLPIGRKALHALQQWLEKRPQLLKSGVCEAVFISRLGKRIQPRTVEYRLKQWSQKTGIALDLHPHQLRHAFASHLLQSSGDLRAVQELLGHQNIRTTQIYTHVNFQHLAQVYDRAHPRAHKNKKPRQ